MISMTDVELSKLLTDLEKTAKALNDASGRVNSILLSCENKIRTSNLGIEVWLENPVDLSDDSEIEPQIVTSAKLGFAKVDNIWCLVTRITPFVNTTNKPVPLLQAPRKVRMGALELLPNLVRALSERAAKRLAAIETAEKLVS
jgi:hypothetical protein